MKSSGFWDVTPHSWLKVNRLFGGICRPHIPDQRTKQTRRQNEAGSSISFDPENGGIDVSPKRRLIFNGLHDVISQKIEVFTVCMKEKVCVSELRNLSFVLFDYTVDVTYILYH
jgi:hydrogenase maturation factor HypE